MVPSLVSLCAAEVVSDHSLSPFWLEWIPRELYRALLYAAFSINRPLAVMELVEQWPDRTLQVGLRKTGATSPNGLCKQALLLAVLRGLSDQRSALQLLDLCVQQVDEGRIVYPICSWSLTLAVCNMVAEAAVKRTLRKEGERKRKRFLALPRDSDVTRERAEFVENNSTASSAINSEEELTKGVRRGMEMDWKGAGPSADKAGTRMHSDDNDLDVLVHVRADLLVNVQTLEFVQSALSTQGPLKLQCRYLRIEDLSVSSVKTLLNILPHQFFLGIDISYRSFVVAGLAEFLPLLSTFPALESLRLRYTNFSPQRTYRGREEELRNISHGLTQLHHLKCIRIIALWVHGQLQMLLSSLPQPLVSLELPYSSLSPADLAYLPCSHHASTLQQLDLSYSILNEATLPSVRSLLSQVSSSLQHLSLTGCNLTDRLLGLFLPSLGRCFALKSLAFALNPLSMSGLMDLVKTAVNMRSLRRLLYTHPLEDYQPGLPNVPSSVQLLDWPLADATVTNTTTHQLNRVLMENGRSDLLLTCNFRSYDQNLRNE